MDANEKPYVSFEPAKFGGHKKLKIYGKLDCPSANRYLRKGQYAKHRVFFASEEDAIGAGYRPCAVCMPEKYKKWKGGEQSND
ncbi:MAG: metal-binding protein [Acetatifactor sp.]|nr:metal-binding protein [Acetatifactor sp.]